jgi:DNA-binding XRE family transcriptional regulator
VAAKTNRRWCDSCAERLPNSCTDALCEPCSSMARPEFRPLVTEEFYDRPEHAELRRALAKHDFGPLLRAVRWECNQMSQKRLGLLVGVGQGTISRVENGERCGPQRLQQGRGGVSEGPGVRRARSWCRARS